MDLTRREIVAIRLRRDERMELERAAQRERERLATWGRRILLEHAREQHMEVEPK